MKFRQKLVSSLKFNESTKELPVLPVRELVIFPNMVAPLFAGKTESLKSIEYAMANKSPILLIYPNKKTYDFKEKDYFQTGSIVKMLQTLKLPDGSIRILVEGMERASISNIFKKEDTYHAGFKIIQKDISLNSRYTALMKLISDSYTKFLKDSKKVNPDLFQAIEKAEYPDKLINLICSNAQFKYETKISILEERNTETRLELVAEAIESENELLFIKNKIDSKVKKKIDKTQRDFYLNEQLKQINKELGKDNADPNGVESLKNKIAELELEDEIKEKVLKDLNRLSSLQAFSPESGILRAYIEWICDLPWNNKTSDNKDIEKAAEILDQDHYNMKEAKERILDFIAVRQLKEKIKGPILCFVGPPGTGKTSLGKSVARALDRKFVRISLGGVRDEAEIRGHRKTYVGALPGKILQSMKRAGSTNPVFLLDEIDKINSDFRGDPASALLEVLDPEQNINFVDHYLEVPYDLSNVMFITTANSISSIPLPLRDRMEIIEIPGYTEFEKLNIAQNFIIPKQLKENGLEWADIKFHKTALLGIIKNYTMESGVRNLERVIATIIRKIARKAVKADIQLNEDSKKEFKVSVTEKNLKSYLGNEKYQRDLSYKKMRPGLAHGLAWTEMGGTILPIEVSVFEGKGELILTGNLGDVMKESARTALSLIKASAPKFDLDLKIFENKDIHVHVPEGAIPKDGPSAGITMTSAILSSFLNKKLKSGLAMTGEITLTGRVLKIGGVKEKVLAAHRNKMNTVIMPEANKNDIEELPKEVKTAIEFIFADDISAVIENIF